MTPMTSVRRLWPFLALLLAASFATGQTPAAPPAPPSPTATAQPPAPATPPSPVSGIRNKISAADLLSAESILEVHRDKYGEDGPYLVGLSWLARGALLMGDREKAKRYGADVRARCGARIAKGEDLEKDHNLETAWGAATEVEAQLIAREKGGERRAAEFLRSELSRLEGPVALRSRLNKRLNMLALTGSPAPEIEIEDFLGDRPPTLASLRGKPVLLFVWAEYCGDCRAQAAALAHAKAHYADKGLQVVALTRYYEQEPPDRIQEKARVDSVWKADYADVGTVPLVFSTPSMVRYGGSSTPTFVFVDRAGIVRRYTPTRLTEAELDRTLATTVR
jgi:thiol-disulfide isomerase/thioredoxin